MSYLLDLFFPKTCLGCGKLDTYCCTKCVTKIDFYDQSLTYPNLESVLVLAYYQGLMKELIATFKYQGVKEISGLLADLIDQKINLPHIETITYLPLHPKKLKIRGFNQAEEIATHLAKKNQLPLTQLLKRVKHLSPQAEIENKVERQARVKNIFEPTYDQIDLESVLLIDDVTTTGSTLNEAARILKQAGCQKIYGLVVAHGQ